MAEDIRPLLRMHDYFHNLSDEILSEIAELAEVTHYDTAQHVHRALEPIHEPVEDKMTTRREILAAAAMLGPLALTMKPAQATTDPDIPGQDAPDMADCLFVQNARGVAYADGKLILKGVNLATVMFSDRPDRIAGHMTTARFVPFWSEGKDSFLKDPPNATLSFLEKGDMADAVVVLRDPVLEGVDLSYQVEVLEGDIPSSAGAASLFIDIIGMPRTPMSFAGARRRTWRRAVIY